MEAIMMFCGAVLIAVVGKVYFWYQDKKEEKHS
jgi:hypothetical protein